MLKHSILPLCTKLTKSLDTLWVNFHRSSVPNEIVRALLITKCLSLWLAMLTSIALLSVSKIFVIFTGYPESICSLDEKNNKIYQILCKDS